MTVRRAHSALVRSKKFRQRQRADARNKAVRSLRVETLEERRLLATGPQLVGIQPNGDEFIVDGDIRETAPTTLTFRFDNDQVIDAATLDAIQITRSGNDGLFGDAEDVVIQITSTDGTLVRVLRENGANSGAHEMLWDGLDANGAQMPKGSYTIQVTATDSEDNEVAARAYFNGVLPPATLASDEAVRRFVADEPRAIGYVRREAVDDSVRVVMRIWIGPHVQLDSR